MIGAMIRRRILIVAVVAVVLTLGVIALRSNQAQSRRGVLLSLGDSVAAGAGLGPSHGYPDNPMAYPARAAATLGWRSVNLAISGACAATSGAKGAAGAANGTAASCKRSILSDQIPRLSALLKSAPDAISISVGANDIEFAKCGLAAIAPMIAGDDPCSGAGYTRRLAAARTNLAAVLGRLRTLYPSVPLYLMQYYNPSPSAPATDRDICPLYEPLAILRSPLSLLLPGGERSTMRQIQTEIFQRSRDIVRALNDMLAAEAAGGRTTVVVPVDFTGHDPCRGRTGGSPADAWVFGPDVHIRFSAGSGPAAITRRTDETLPYACPDLSEQAPPFTTGGPVTRHFGPVAVTYSATVAGNCLPHPTAAGHRALASALVKAIRSR